MISSWLKQVYTSKILREEVEIFKQDHTKSEKAPESIAVVSKNVYDDTIKDIINSFDEKNDFFDRNYLNSILEDMGISKKSEFYSSVFNFIKKTGIKYNKENTDKFKNDFLSACRNNLRTTLVSMIEKSFESTIVNDYSSDLISLVGVSGRKGGKNIGEGEFILAVLTGTGKAEEGDIDIDGYKVEVKAKGGKLTDINPSTQNLKDLMRKAVETREEKDIMYALKNFVSPDGDSEEEKTEMLTHPVIADIISNKKEELLSIFKNKVETNTWKRGGKFSLSSTIPDFAGAAALSSYRKKSRFNALLVMKQINEVPMVFVDATKGIETIARNPNLSFSITNWFQAGSDSQKKIEVKIT